MATQNNKGQFIISAGEVGAFSVCPMAWKLKWLDKVRGEKDKKSIDLGKELHTAWSTKLEEAFWLIKAVRYLIAFACAAIVVFLFIHSSKNGFAPKTFYSLNANTIELLLVLIGVYLVTFIVGGAARSKKRESGFETVERIVDREIGNLLIVGDIISDRQGLAGKPDGLMEENGFIVPVERKPLAKKIRERYVAQILVYMRLIEERYSKRPPHGYLILGPQCRRVKIDNTIEKQRWLQDLIDEMQKILHGKNANPEPHTQKCKKCDVVDACLVGREYVEKIGRR